MAVHLKALLETTQLLQPNEVEDQTCPVCFEDYLQDPSREFPRKLPCGHVIGTECLLLWASSQTHAISINCPWCTRPIIHSIDAKYLETVMTAYVEAGLEQIPVQFERAIAAVEHGLTEDPPGIITAVIFLTLPGMYFDTVLAWLPMELFLFAVQVANKRRVVAFPRLGAVLMVLGLCVGTVFDKHLGFTLLRYGKMPFHAAIARFCSDHARLVSGLTLVLIGVGAVLKVPAVSMLAIEATGYLLRCLVLYVLTRMMA